ncbi:MAG: hypothetical protein U5N55_09080 [Cypionkella sp.]|nr:hypothetical protein [Cypionkella sp.]
MLPREKHILTAEEITSGGDDLGVLIYGHGKGAMVVWLAPVQCAGACAGLQRTGMQVTSAVLAAMVWAIENPSAGCLSRRMTWTTPAA